MDFRVAPSFTGALARMSVVEQKAVKLSLSDLWLHPKAPGLQLHRIHASRDANFWSARVNQDLRLILHRTEAAILVAFVGHHDDAYAWAARRRMEEHPKTGAIQIIEVRELVEEMRPRFAATPAYVRPPSLEPRLFAALDDENLLSLGVPADWLPTVREADASGWDRLSEHLPPDVAQALEDYYTGGELRPPPPTGTFRVVATRHELERALVEPWPSWGPMRRAAFHQHLLTDFRGIRTGQPLDRRSADSYRAYVSRLELTLRIKLDETDLTESKLEEITDRWRAEGARLGIPRKTISNCVSGLRAYAQFRRFAPVDCV